MSEISPNMQTINNYKVFVLGASGSGKTVLLSSLFKHLSVQSDELDFYLKCEDQSVMIKLIDRYNKLTGPEGEWPESTIKHQEYKFLCKNNKTDMPLFKFTYLDYAGELITTNNPNKDKIFKYMNESESILALIDGLKVLYYMEDDKDLPKYIKPLTHDLDFILTILQDIDHNKSIHFVITKWDLLNGKYTVAQIVKKLKSYRSFNNIVVQRKTDDIPIRIIPISAVGNDFAELDKNGIVKKLPNNNPPNPYNIELSIAFTIFDGLKIMLDSHYNNRLKGNLFKRVIIILFGATNVLTHALKTISSVSFSFPPPYNFSSAQLATIISMLDKTTNAGYKKRIKTLKTIEKKYDTKSNAFESVIRKMRDLCERLEFKHPGSSF